MCRIPCLILCLGNVSGGTRRRADALALSDLSSPRCGPGRARQVLTRSTLTLDGAGRGARRVARLDMRTWTALPARCRRSTRARRSTCSAARRANLDGAPGPVQALDAGQALDVQRGSTCGPGRALGPQLAPCGPGRASGPALDAGQALDVDARRRGPGRSTCGPGRAPGPVQALDAGQALDVDARRRGPGRSTCSAARRANLDGAPGPVQALDAGQALDVQRGSTCGPGRALGPQLAPCGPGRAPGQALDAGHALDVDARRRGPGRSTCSAARRANLDGAPGPVQALDAGQALERCMRGGSGGGRWTRSRTWSSLPCPDLDALDAGATRSTLMLDGAGRGARRVARLDVRTWTALPARCRRSTRCRSTGPGARRGPGARTCSAARRADLDALSDLSSPRADLDALARRSRARR